MAARDAPVIEPLGRQHDRTGFSCGEPGLDNYLRQRASQDVRQRIAQIFVALGSSESEIAGYHMLGAAALRRGDLSPELAKRLSRYPLPAPVLGRLAVNSSYHGQGLGEHLLIDALHRVMDASSALSVCAVIVDAENGCLDHLFAQGRHVALRYRPVRSGLCGRSSSLDKPRCVDPDLEPGLSARSQDGGLRYSSARDRIARRRPTGNGG